MVQAGQTSVCYDADFYPFGGERGVVSTCTQNYKFEGKERDTETGNDDFGARYYTSRLGRWLSADWSSVPVPVPYANLTNPQTLNLYAMVSDNPETFADLDGHCGDNCDGQPRTDPSGSGKKVCDLKTDKCNDPTTKNVNGHDQDQAQQQSGRQFSPTDPTSLRKGKTEAGPNGGIIQDYQVVDAHGHPVRKVSVQEHVKVLVHENVNGVPNPNPVYYPTGEVRDEIGPTSPPSTNTQHEFLKTEQTFTAYKNGHAYPLTTVINQYVDVNKGRVTAETVVVVP